MSDNAALDSGVPPLWPAPKEGETITVEYYEDDEGDDNTCPACGGSGCDSFESFMPCEECDGEGYRWWE